MTAICFKTKLLNIKSWTILRLPKGESDKLPSRGLALAEGTINDVPFKAVLEPDGRGSHWYKIDKTLLAAAGASVDDTVAVILDPSHDWPEPAVPEDLKSALEANQLAMEIWTKTTPLARWDWIRWIGSTRQTDTRRRRIEAACDKLAKGERRACCFNRNLCTEPYLSQGGKLIEPTSAGEPSDG